MKTLKFAVAAALGLMLSGCLEVKQYPGWVDGQYAGKRDNRSAQVRFHNDKLAWRATVLDRTQYQNDYRARP